MLFKRKSSEPATDKGERIYAIGDIHGRFDLFQDLLARIDVFEDSLPSPRALRLILLGDLVDRGPASSRVLNFVHKLGQRTDRLVVLQGNHEHVMLRALQRQPDVMPAWLRMGGDATLRSYGIDPDGFETEQEMIAHARQRIPEDLLDWMRALPLTARSGDYFFCHAGIRPGVSLRRQSSLDLQWIREEFLEAEQSHGAVIVHGHSIRPSVEVRSNRIGIDTGAYRTGVLTALYLEGTRREILSTGEQAALAG